MKRILIVLAVLSVMPMASAQVKSTAAAKAALESAKSATTNPKKAAKAATWIKLGQAYIDAYNAPMGNVLIGSSKTELQLMMGNDRPLSSETVEVNGMSLTKEVYADKNLYFDNQGVLRNAEVTKPIDENALSNAREAFAKAVEVEEKAAKSKDIIAGLSQIQLKYIDEAYAAYSRGDIALASNLFENAVATAAQAPLSQIDTSSIYNTGFTAMHVGNYPKAKDMFEKCLTYDYFGEDGDVFAKLSECAEKLGDKEGSQKYLEDGFTKFPQSQVILIGLINYYMSNGEDTGRLFSLLDEAKKNEPDNASLYYVEGNIYGKLNDVDKAVESYRKCAQIDPKYAFGYIGEGILFYNQALELQEKAQNELDDAKYAALMESFDKALRNSIEPFEKAYDVSDDKDIKVNVAEYLKNIYFRYREEKPEYQAAYEKFNKIVSTGNPE